MAAPGSTALTPCDCSRMSSRASVSASSLTTAIGRWTRRRECGRHRDARSSSRRRTPGRRPGPRQDPGVHEMAGHLDGLGECHTAGCPPRVEPAGQLSGRRLPGRGKTPHTTAPSSGSSGERSRSRDSRTAPEPSTQTTPAMSSEVRWPKPRKVGTSSRARPTSQRDQRPAGGGGRRLQPGQWRGDVVLVVVGRRVEGADRIM